MLIEIDGFRLHSNDVIETAHAFPGAIVIGVHNHGWAHFAESAEELAAAFGALRIADRLAKLEFGKPRQASAFYGLTMSLGELERDRRASAPARLNPAKPNMSIAQVGASGTRVIRGKSVVKVMGVTITRSARALNGFEPPGLQPSSRTVAAPAQM